MTDPYEFAEPRPTTEHEPSARLAPPPYDHDRLARERSVRGQFLRDAMAASKLSEQDKNLIMRVGLLALDGYDDLEVG